jgi:hypothetical protein
MVRSSPTPSAETLTLLTGLTYWTLVQAGTT